MGRPVLAYHVVFSTYGFWLPNDPRGSWSEYVGSRALQEFGPATKVATRRSVAKTPHDHQLRLAAKQALKYPPVSLTGVQARAIGRGFDQAVEGSDYRCHACAILPEHIHLIIARHERHIRRIEGHLKARATQRLMEERLWPDSSRPVWGRKDWHVFLFTPDDVRRAIRYVEENPPREGKPRQRWPFSAVRSYLAAELARRAAAETLRRASPAAKSVDHA